MFFTRKKHRSGFTLVELMVTMLISLILISAVGTVLVGGQRSWNRAYRSANKRIKTDALAAMAAFRTVGRKSDRSNYNITNSSPIPIPLAQANTAVVSGNKVTFNYWKYPRDGRRRYSPAQIPASPTHYATFYFQGDQLKVEYGTVPNTPTHTQILAQNVSDCKFEHTQIGGVGQRCVRMTLTLVDPEDGETITVKTATLIRN